MKGLMKVVTLTLFVALSVPPVSGQATQPVVNWIGMSTDWQPQDYRDSQGICCVQPDPDRGRLVAEAHLVGKHDNYGKGEVFLDLAYFPDLDCQVPIDFRQRQIEVEVEVPNGFVGLASAPNGVQVFVKDDKYRFQYSEWKNVTTGGKHTVRLSPMTVVTPDDRTERNFDPSRIRIIGVKFAIGTGSPHTYDGPLFLNSISVNPPLLLSIPPNLPQSTPPPVFSPGDRIEVRSDGFYLNNARWFMVGGNWRVTEYGQNFGVTAWFPSGNGISKHPNFARINLDYLRRVGTKVVRVGLLDDGRIMFDRAGHVVGYSSTFQRDVRTFLDLANQAGVKVEFTILDFLIAGRGKEEDGVLVRGRREVITDPMLRDEFRTRFLMQFLAEFKDHPALLTFDVINEPEWIVNKRDGGGWEDYDDLETKAEMPVPVQDLNAFVTECVDTIRGSAPDKLVTVGVSARFIPLVKNLNLDYLALHHYHWMGDLGSYVPSQTMGKVWSLEEFPTKYPANATPRSIREYLNLVSNLRGTGGMPWNLSPGIDPSTFICCERPPQLVDLRRWVDGQPPAAIDPQKLTSVSAASFIPDMELSREAIVAAFGNNLATATMVATTTPLPTELAGTRVKVKDAGGIERDAPLFSVSPMQVNYLVQPGTATGCATVTVTSRDGTVSTGMIQIAPVGPGLFSANANGQGVAATVVLRIRANGEQVFEPVARFDQAQNRFVAVPIDLGPESDQVFLILYGTGIRFYSSLSAVTVRVGGIDVPVRFAGAAPGFVGLDQINALLLRSLMGRGEVDVGLTVDGKVANTVKVNIR